MKVDVYLNYRGKCEEAFRFYEQHLGATVGMLMTHGESPDQSRVDPSWKDAVLHARLQIGGTELLGADIPDAEPMRSAYLSLSLDGAAEAERVYTLLSEGGQIFMPLASTFFAERFAMLRDRFGTSWMLMSPPAQR